MLPKLLIVDDDAPILESMRDLLRSRFEEVLLAGPEDPYHKALELAGRNPQSIALVDLALPKARGEGSVELGFDLIRQLIDRYGIAVVVHSAFDSEENQARAAALGAREFIAKGRKAPEIRAIMDQLVRRQAESPRSGTQDSPPPADYHVNRNRVPEQELRRFLGQWVAFSPDGTAVVASAPDRADLDRRLSELGRGVNDVVLEYIPDEDVFCGGAEVL